jgi:imidazolonepropionase-like amidohydrolase
VDEHSHIAISRGVNEAGQAITSEVSIGDVVDAEDINIYRQLAGGVTAAQLLHGSANPIGGQSALVKLRWGKTPAEMKIRGADGFIKFALGENVKQSNWGDEHTVRFPQTRMGVEQVFYDAFHRAKNYRAEQEIYAAGKKKEKKKTASPRRDLELEALAEILDSQRFITCHSYIQSEINMLMHVADSMNFRINTFTHILEGYKVADMLREHGAAASTFSDWWAYKFEVNDAIPYNAALLHERGVLTGFNSDDAEMGRRLNQEAAKAVKYGGVSEEEAWKFITLNPAKMLHLDHRMGSIKAGKDADLVLWSAHPLSVYTHAEQTYIDGSLYFDRERDKMLGKRDAEERERIVKKMMQSADKKKAQKYQPEEKKLYHCETMEQE